MSARRLLGTTALAIAVTACVGCASAWPLWHHEEADGRTVTEIAWPLYERVEEPDRTLTVLRPFYAREETPERTVVDFVYPLFRRVEQPGYERWRLLPVAWHNRTTDPDTGETVSSDTIVVPFWWDTADAREGSPRRTRMLVPFYGRFEDRFGVDEGGFVLLPGWLWWRRGEFEGRSILWPLVAWGEGDGERFLRILPIHARRTVDAGSPRAPDGRAVRVRSWLWPLWSNVRTGDAVGDRDWDRPGATGSASTWLMPLWGRQVARGPGGRITETRLIPPLFLHRRNHDTGERLVHAPYPFVRFGRWDGTARRELWPVTGRREDAQAGPTAYALDFWMFPTVSSIRQRETDEDGETIYRWSGDFFLPFHWRTDSEIGGTTLRHEMFVPWMRLREERDPGRRGAVRVRTGQVPAILPLEDPDGLGRTWAPFWRLVEWRSDGDGTRLHLLHRLLRTHTGPDGELRSLSILGHGIHGDDR